VVGIDAQYPDAAMGQLAGTVNVNDVHRLATSKVTLEIAEHGHHLEQMFLEHLFVFYPKQGQQKSPASEPGFSRVRTNSLDGIPSIVFLRLGKKKGFLLPDA